MAGLPEGLEILIDSEITFQGVLKSPSSIMVADDGCDCVIAPSDDGELFLSYLRERKGSRYKVLEFSQTDKLLDALCIMICTGEGHVHYVVHRTLDSLKEHQERIHLNFKFQEIPFEAVLSRMAGDYQSR